MITWFVSALAATRHSWVETCKYMERGCFATPNSGMVVYLVSASGFTSWHTHRSTKPHLCLFIGRWLWFYDIPRHSTVSIETESITLLRNTMGVTCHFFLKGQRRHQPPTESPREQLSLVGDYADFHERRSPKYGRCLLVCEPPARTNREKKPIRWHRYQWLWRVSWLGHQETRAENGTTWAKGDSGKGR